MDLFVIDVDLVATRLTQHVTGWCVGGPCGSVCDRRGSRRYTSDTACHLWCIGGPCGSVCDRRGSVCDRRGSRRYTSDTACHWMVYRWSLWICL